MCQHQLKRNLVEEQCSKFKDRQPNALSDLSSQSPAVCSTTSLCEVWVEEAAILIEQVQYDYPLAEHAQYILLPYCTGSVSGC